MNGAPTSKQWGFRKGKSTEGLLMHTTEIWRHALDNGKVVGVLFIDFKKAFDSINHKILYKKLQGVGIAGLMLDILSDYLENRSQYVEKDGSQSSSRIITYGVPQGSLLGPRLFSIYINDLADNILKGNLYLFADDSTLHCIGDNIEVVIDSLNEAASEVNRWCNHNQLSIHPGKSEILIITSQQFTGPLRPVKIGTDAIKFVNKSTFLGITTRREFSIFNDI
jgi:retron-type reverse transcriptase